METHPPHVHHTSGKKISQYFYEFLMLFMAVFSGFLAENQREHFVEEKRAGEYAKSLLYDLVSDTFEISAAVHQANFLILSIDSLTSMSFNINSSNEVPASFYYYSRCVSRAFTVDWTKSTIYQLVQSGNLRYFKNKKLVELVNTYFFFQDVIKIKNESDVLRRDKICEVQNCILQSRFYSKFSELDIVEEEYGHQPSPIIDTLLTKILPLQTEGRKRMDEYINQLSDRKSSMRRNIYDFYPQAYKVNLEIIKMLKTEYHLE